MHRLQLCCRPDIVRKIPAALGIAGLAAVCVLLEMHFLGFDTQQWISRVFIGSQLMLAAYVFLHLNHPQKTRALSLKLLLFSFGLYAVLQLL